VIFAASLYM